MAEPGLDYTRENEAERRDEDEEQEARDRQEALSVYQAMGLRLVWLSSEKWAIIYGARQIELASALDEDWMRSTAASERAEWEQRREISRRESAAVSGTSKTVEELGL